MVDHQHRADRVWRRHLQLESLFAASLALLIDQLRSTANGATIGASLSRLEAVARMGSLRLDAEALRAASLLDTATAVGAALMANAMATHQITTIEVHRSVSRDECLALARALMAPAPMDRAEAAPVLRNALWNIKVVASAPAPSSSQARRAASVSPGTVLQHAAAAVKAGNASEVIAVLSAVAPDPVFRAAATPGALQLVADVVANPTGPDLSAAMAILNRAGEEGVRAVFQHLMASEDMAERRRCFDACRDLPKGTRVFVEYLTHPLWYVVRNAALLLGETGATSAVSSLGRLLKHDEERVRIAAATALGQLGGPEARARLETALHDSSAEVRRLAMSVLFANQEHWSERYSRGTTSDVTEDETMRVEMVRALGRVSTQAAAQKLEAMAAGRDPDSTLDVRLAAMDALAEGHRALAMKLLPRFAFDPQPTVRAKVAELLG